MSLHNALAQVFPRVSTPEGDPYRLMTVDEAIPFFLGFAKQMRSRFHWPNPEKVFRDHHVGHSELQGALGDYTIIGRFSSSDDSCLGMTVADLEAPSLVCLRYAIGMLLTIREDLPTTMRLDVLRAFWDIGIREVRFDMYPQFTSRYVAAGYQVRGPSTRAYHINNGLVTLADNTVELFYSMPGRP